MHHVQEGLIAGGNGKGKQIGGGSGEGDVPEGDDVLKGVVDHLAKSRGSGGGDGPGKTKSYLDAEMDLPGLDVPDREE